MGCLPTACRAGGAPVLPGACGSPGKIASGVPKPCVHLTSTRLLPWGLLPRTQAGQRSFLPAAAAHAPCGPGGCCRPASQNPGHPCILPPASFCLQLAVIRPETRAFPRSLSNAFIIIVIILLFFEDLSRSRCL